MEMKTSLLSLLVSLIDACDEHSLRASYLLGKLKRKIIGAIDLF